MIACIHGGSPVTPHSKLSIDRKLKGTVDRQKGTVDRQNMIYDATVPLESYTAVCLRPRPKAPATWFPSHLVSETKWLGHWAAPSVALGWVARVIGVGRPVALQWGTRTPLTFRINQTVSLGCIPLYTHCTPPLPSRVYHTKCI